MKKNVFNAGRGLGSKNKTDGFSLEEIKQTHFNISTFTSGGCRLMIAIVSAHKGRPKAFLYNATSMTHRLWFTHERRWVTVIVMMCVLSDSFFNNRTQPDILRPEEWRWQLCCHASLLEGFSRFKAEGFSTICQGCLRRTKQWGSHCRDRTESPASAGSRARVLPHLRPHLSIQRSGRSQANRLYLLNMICSLCFFLTDVIKICWFLCRDPVCCYTMSRIQHSFTYPLMSGALASEHRTEAGSSEFYGSFLLK